MTATASAQVFDKKFVVAASLIGAVYAAVVVVLGSVLGKEAAGVAGVALTAIATGIFKQFETLRFRPTGVGEYIDVSIPTLSWSRLIVFASAFLGLGIFVGMIAGIGLALSDLAPNITGMESFYELLSDWKVLVALVGVNLVVYLLGGFAIAKAFKSSSYSTLLIAAFSSCLLMGLLPLIPIAVKKFDLFVELLMSGALWPATFWLLYVGAALLGAQLANRRGVPQPALLQEA